ncbi:MULTISPECIES: hypothetical protein [unclassified Streptomyces]|uniref:hypothetical protein n=1 Tax=unclassified Streptomyces TaxID=2593676 RepID=UPI002E2B6A86|nr:hypothetical protein [Streptomyces sp. NBC_00223]
MTGTQALRTALVTVALAAAALLGTQVAHADSTPGPQAGQTQTAQGSGGTIPNDPAPSPTNSPDMNNPWD